MLPTTDSPTWLRGMQNRGTPTNSPRFWVHHVPMFKGVGGNDAYFNTLHRPGLGESVSFRQCREFLLVSTRRQELVRILLHTFDPHLKMQVRPG